MNAETRSSARRHTARWIFVVLLAIVGSLAILASGASAGPAAAVSVATRTVLRGHHPDLGEQASLRVFLTVQAYDRYHEGLGPADIFPSSGELRMNFDVELLALYHGGKDRGGRCLRTASANPNVSIEDTTVTLNLMWVNERCGAPAGADHPFVLVAIRRTANNGTAWISGSRRLCASAPDVEGTTACASLSGTTVSATPAPTAAPIRSRSPDPTAASVRGPPPTVGDSPSPPVAAPSVLVAGAFVGSAFLALFVIFPAAVRLPHVSRTALAVAVICAALGGASILAHPAAPLAVVTAAAAAIILLNRAVLARIFLVYLGLLLLGYAFFSRAFAYLGVAPIYLGEIGLALAGLVLVRHWRRLWSPGALELLLVAFMVVGAVHTVRFLPRDGLDALRDGVLWGYAFFAFAVAALLRGHHFARIADTYGHIAPAFVVWVVVAALLSVSASLPTVPGSSVSVVTFKGGDMGVHLAGIAAFVVVGLFLRGRTIADFASAILIPLWVLAIAVAGSINRGGLFAAMVGWGAVVLIRPSRRWTLGVVLAGALLSLVALVDPTIDVGKRREISLDQIGANLSSAVLDTGDPNLDGTRHFRLRWWSEIVDYTLFGPYFWTGKGFGINLADEDGFQIRTDGSVRAPHNSHLTVLARMGIPGITLWVLLQGLFAANLLAACIRARRRGAVFWAQIDAWLLFYWLAMIVNTSFDPYLEGPQGGIWFWSVFGASLAALRVQREELREAGR